MQTDFDKWVDEDEEQTDVDMSGMDFNGMGGGMGGMPGMVRHPAPVPDSCNPFGRQELAELFLARPEREVGFADV